jgi:hypothetical protein
MRVSGVTEERRGIARGGKLECGRASLFPILIGFLPYLTSQAGADVETRHVRPKKEDVGRRSSGNAGRGAMSELARNRKRFETRLSRIGRPSQLGQ